jgi:hypothetical protein
MLAYRQFLCVRGAGNRTVDVGELAAVALSHVQTFRGTYSVLRVIMCFSVSAQAAGG